MKNRWNRKFLNDRVKRDKAKNGVVPLLSILFCLMISLTSYAAMGGQAEQVKNHFHVKQCREYRIHFDANRAKYGLNFLGEMEDQVLSFDEAAQLTRNGYSFPGAKFVCWTTESEPGAGAARYTDGQKVCNLAPEDKDEVTLYAQWENVPKPLDQGYYSVQLTGGKGMDGYFYHSDESGNLMEEQFAGGSGERFSGLIYAEQGTVVSLSGCDEGEKGATYRCIGTRKEDGSIEITETTE